MKKGIFIILFCVEKTFLHLLSLKIDIFCLKSEFPFIVYLLFTV